MKQVNLKEILDKELKFLSVRVNQIEVACLRAMQEACNQTVDLCAKNAETNKEITSESGVLKEIGTVNKQSILDTKKQII